MADTTERNWTEPIGGLSMQWAREIAQQIPGEYHVSIKPYTTLKLPADRYGAMISYVERQPGDRKNVKILTHVNACVRHDDQREIRVQVYSSTGSGTGGFSHRWLAPANTVLGCGDYTVALLEAIGVWAFMKRLDVVAQINLS